MLWFLGRVLNIFSQHFGNQGPGRPLLSLSRPLLSLSIHDCHVLCLWGKACQSQGSQGFACRLLPSRPGMQLLQLLLQLPHARGFSHLSL